MNRMKYQKARRGCRAGPGSPRRPAVRPRILAVLLLVCMGGTPGAAAAAVVDESLIHTFVDFRGTSNSIVRDVQVGPDGSIYAVGDFNSIDGLVTGSTARFRPNGTLDAVYSLGTRFSSIAYSCALQEDGRLIVGFQSFSDDIRDVILQRLTSEGALDPSFDVGYGPFNLDFASTVFDILVAGPDEIYVAGAFNLWDGTEEVYHLVRLRGDGSLDTEFTPEILSEGVGLDANAAVRTVARYPDGRLLIGGRFSHVNGEPFNCIARLHADGSIDDTFQPGDGPAFSRPELPGFAPSVSKALLQPDGKIVLAGTVTTFDHVPTSGLFRLHEDGTVDTGFSVDLIVTGEGPFTWGEAYDWVTVFDVVSDAQGRLLAIGLFNQVNGVPRRGVVRLHPDGSVDHSFDPGVSMIHLSDGNLTLPFCIAVDAQGRPVAGGNIIRPDESITGLLRYLSPLLPEILHASYSVLQGAAIRVANPAGDTLRLEATTDFIDWSGMATNATGAAEIEFEAAGPAGSVHWIYRVVTQP